MTPGGPDLALNSTLVQSPWQNEVTSQFRTGFKIYLW